MTEPVVIEPMMQKDVWDCGIACLAMLLGLPYQQVRAQVRFKEPVGLSGYELRRIAKSLKRPITLKPAPESEDIGILMLDRPVTPGGRKREGHVVLFIRGIIYNPAQGDIWTVPEAYTLKGRWQVLGIFVTQEES